MKSFGAGVTTESMCPCAFIIIIESKWNVCTSCGHCATPAECTAACCHATGTCLLVLSCLCVMPYWYRSDLFGIIHAL